MSINKENTLTDWRAGHVRQAVEAFNKQFPDLTWGTYGGHQPTKDLATDGMVPGYKTAAGKARGWEAAKWLWANREKYGIHYIIFDGKIISRTPGRESWRTYSPSSAAARKSPDSAYHRNHVHVSFYSTAPEPEEFLPTYYVDPAKVSTTLTANAPAGKKDLQRPPGFPITTGVRIDGNWLETAAGYRYHLGYLTKTKPVVKLPTYWVDPKKVTGTLTAIAPAGKPNLQRPPRFAVTTANRIEDGYVVTDAGYRYPLASLTTTKPAPEPSPKPGKLTLRLKSWNGSPAGRTLIQGVRWDPLSKSHFIHQADDVAGRNEQTVVIRRHDADGTYRGYTTITDAGHGSSLGLEPVRNGVVRLWIGHATKGAGYVTYTIGQADTPFTKVPLPNGDITVDPDTDTVCVRSGTSFKGYRMSAAREGKTVELWRCTIPNWLNRFQGHLIAGGRLYIHRDEKTKGQSVLRAYSFTGKLLEEWDTSAWGDEAEGALVKDGWVWSVSRVGGNNSGRTVVCTPIEPINH